MFVLSLFREKRFLMGKKTIKGSSAPENFKLEHINLRILLKTIPDLVWLKDIDGKFLFCNPKFERYIGSKESDILGKSEFDFIDEELALFYHKNDMAAIEANASLINIEWLTYADDGHQELVETIKTPMYCSNGKLIGVLGIARDITERYRAEESLKERESNYRQFFEGNPMPMWIIDLSTLSFLEINQAAITHYGYTKDEFLSMTLKDIRPAEDLDEFHKNISKLIDRNTFSGVARHIKKNKETIYVEITSNEIEFKNRKCHLVLINDITDKKVAEDEFRKLSRATEQSTASIIITNKEGNIEYVNPKFTKLSGYSLKESLGKNPRFLKSGYTNSEEYKKLWETIFSGGEWHGEFKNLKKNGETYFETASISPILNNEGEITHFIALKEDITEKKRNENDLRKFMMGIESSSDAIFITSIDGSIEYINPAFEKIYGYSRSDSLGKTPRILKSGLVTPESYKYFWDTLLAGKSLKGEIKNKTKDGRIINVEGSNNPILDNNGNVVGFLSINRDITDRKLVETELVAAKEKAEEGDRLKTAFLNNISHEIRTPLNGIVGFSALLSEPEIDTETQSGFIESIQKCSDQLLTIINDIVDIADVMAKTTKSYICNVDLNSICYRTANRFRNEASDKNIKLSFVTSFCSDKCEIMTDSSMLVRILSNLISNAVKYTSQGEVKFGFKQKDSFIEFFVTDSGIGIPLEYQPRIFQNFYQVEQSLSRFHKGTGLGLPICKAFTEYLGGKIWFESEPEKGSTFYFTLPYIQPEQNNKS